MGLRRLHIDGYLRFNDFGIEFGPELNVVHGPNEAGKSTLLRFVRYVLFGPPRLTAQRGLPLKGTQYGGTLWLGSFRLQRTGKDLRLDAAGVPCDPQDLAELLGHLDRAAFDAVFACDLDDLRHMSALEADGLRRKLFAATVLGTSIDTDVVEARWSKRRKTLASRGRHGVIWQLEQALTAARRELAAAQELALALPEMVDRVSALDEAVTEQDGTLQRLLVEHRQYEALEAARPLLAQWRELSAWRAEHPRPIPVDAPLAELRRAYDSLPDLAALADAEARARAMNARHLAHAGVEDLESVDLTPSTRSLLFTLASEIPPAGNSDQARAAQREAQDAVGRAQNALDTAPVPGPALDLRHQLDGLRGAVARAEEHRREIDHLRMRLDSLEHQRVDLSAPWPALAEGDPGSLRGLRADVERSREAEMQRHTARRALEPDLQRVRHEVERLSVPLPVIELAPATVEWAERRATMHERAMQLDEDRARRETLARRLDTPVRGPFGRRVAALAEVARSDASARWRFVLRTALFASFLLLVAAVVIGVLTGLGDRATTVILVAVVIGVAALLWDQVRDASALRQQVAHRELAMRDAELAARADTLDRWVAAGATVAREHDRPVPDDLLQAGALAAFVLERREEARRATVAEDARRDALEAQRRTLDELQARYAALETETELDVPQRISALGGGALDPARWTDWITASLDALALAQTHTEVTQDLQRAEQRWARDDGEVGRALTRAGVSSLDALSDALALALRHDAERTTLASQLQAAEAALGQADEELEHATEVHRAHIDAQQALAAALARAGWPAVSASDVRLAAERLDAALAAQTAFDDARRAHADARARWADWHADVTSVADDTVSPSPALADGDAWLAACQRAVAEWEARCTALDDVAATLGRRLPDVDLHEAANRDPDEVERTRARNEEQRAEVRRTMDRLVEERGALKHAIDDLGASARVAEAAERVNHLHARLREARLELAEIELASRWLKQAYEHYVRENQPGVLTRASALLRLATDQTMVAVRQHEGVLYVESADGSTREPGALSRGSRELLYLVIRFALALEHREPAELPLLLDDVMVNQDPERTVQLARILHQVAEHRQVILLTCRPETRDQLVATDPRTTIIELPRLVATA